MHPNCYCGHHQTYQNCCQLAHKDIKTVKTAETLMRSRYSAYALANGDYLMLSHHSSTRPIQEKQEIVKWAKSVQWEKLEVLHTAMGQVNDPIGQVEFKAYYKENGRLKVIHERSKFIKENGHWVYLDAF